MTAVTNDIAYPTYSSSCISLSWLAAPLFVFLWSTGFVVAHFSMPYIEPATFLALRFGGALLILGPFAFAVGARWPNRRQVLHLALSGVLLHAGYLWGVWAAIKYGMGSAMAALIVGLQPLLTAVCAPLIGERASRRQWFGLGLGFIGVVMVVTEKMTHFGVSALTLMMAVVGLVSITAGTLYQKRFCQQVDLRAANVIQFSAALLALMPIVFGVETRDIVWGWPLISSLLWSIFALSIGAISLLLLLVRRSASMNVASMMYLTPAVTAVLAWVFFGERLTWIMFIGMTCVAAGVASVVTPRFKRT